MLKLLPCLPLCGMILVLALATSQAQGTQLGQITGWYKPIASEAVSQSYELAWEQRLLAHQQAFVLALQQKAPALDPIRTGSIASN